MSLAQVGPFVHFLYTCPCHAHVCCRLITIAWQWDDTVGSGKGESDSLMCAKCLMSSLWGVSLKRANMGKCLWSGVGVFVHLPTNATSLYTIWQAGSFSTFSCRRWAPSVFPISILVYNIVCLYQQFNQTWELWINNNYYIHCLLLIIFMIRDMHDIHTMHLLNMNLIQMLWRYKGRVPLAQVGPFVQHLYTCPSNAISLQFDKLVAGPSCLCSEW